VVNAEFFRYAQDDKDGGLEQIPCLWHKIVISALQIHAYCLALLYGICHAERSEASGWSMPSSFAMLKMTKMGAWSKSPACVIKSSSQPSSFMPAVSPYCQ
jgi:hypothetical protein